MGMVTILCESLPKILLTGLKKVYNGLNMLGNHLKLER